MIIHDTCGLTDLINKVAVYGTLKEKHWNHALLKGSQFEGVFDIDGYKMYRKYPDFPVIRPCYDNIDKIRVEVYTINDVVLSRLDSLESEGYMYDRAIVHIDGVGMCFIYVGTYNFWGDCRSLQLTDKNKDGVYDW